jgi:hypothetical protein
MDCQECRNSETKQLWAAPFGREFQESDMARPPQGGLASLLQWCGLAKYCVKRYRFLRRTSCPTSATAPVPRSNMLVGSGTELIV